MTRRATFTALLIVMVHPLWITTASAGAANEAERKVEPWSDPRLKVTTGLTAWFDAGRQAAGQRAGGRDAPMDGGRIATLLDGSGNGRHLMQTFQPAQPRLIGAGDLATLRFDGKDDHLVLAGGRHAMCDLTMVAVAWPHLNAGGFRGLVALAEAGRNDYVTGLNVDLGLSASESLTNVNIEGAGCTGAVNLLTSVTLPDRFSAPHLAVVTSKSGAGGLRLYMDGQAAGRRDRAADSIVHMDRLVLGARLCSNTIDPPYANGFWDGEIAEVLLYDRLLTDDERREVENYLLAKYQPLGLRPAGTSGEQKVAAPPAVATRTRLLTVEDPPPVQVLPPGFSVRRLPVDLPNINNVRYRADGKLLAAAYNGDIYLLSDSDGDGLEDKAELYWDNRGRIITPIGIALTPAGYSRGDGVFIACLGKIILLLDTDHDDKADKEVVVAEGWRKLVMAGGNVDALGVAVDKDGNVYFGLGAANYASAYLTDKEGQAHYDLKGERGTIQRVSADFSRREQVCSGVRFTVGLAFNQRGDLFATDQEGATWLPNGNPFDELLHIQTGRHYGFPPRHPTHLPNVIDEPSVFDYFPQHQSACGLTFNEPLGNEGRAFGPAQWRGDALVCGESRGKLYRAKLVKTEAGYVARNELIARLSMLTLDSTVSPAGDLVAACHSGEPDWGTGPTGRGTLYKITYSDRELPQPMTTWAAGEREVRVAFDRPLDPARLAGLAGRAKIEFGPFVSAADRLETLHPPYEAVRRQLEAPRYMLPILSTAVTPDRRTLVLSTATHPHATNYALTLPGMERPEKPGAAHAELRQEPAIDLAYDLSGVEAAWSSRAVEGSRPLEPWFGWIPHLDLAVADGFTSASAEHDALRERLRSAGTLTLRTKLDLHDMLRPAIQPGSKIDYTWPAEQGTVVLESDRPFTVRRGADDAVTAAAVEGRAHVVKMKAANPAEAPMPIEVILPTGGDAKGEGASPVLRVSFHTQEDNRPRALPLRRFLLPWARPPSAELDPAATTSSSRRIPELEGGDWSRGRDVFRSDKAMCSKCHAISGEGGWIGPDLTNLRHRDYASVMRDITYPSAVINPDHAAYVLTLDDDSTLVGVVRTQERNGQSIVLVGEPGATEKSVPASRIKSRTPLPTSIMPVGMPDLLGPQKMKDLLTYLLTESPIDKHMAPAADGLRQSR